MHLSSITLLVLASTTHAFTPAGTRRAQSLRAGQWWDDSTASGAATDAGSTPAAAPTTAAATGEHQIKAGDHIRIHYTLSTTSGLPLDGSELTFDTEEVDIVVNAGGFIPPLHNALNGASLTVDQPETLTLSKPFGERDPRLARSPCPRPTPLPV